MKFGPLELLLKAATNLVGFFDEGDTRSRSLLADITFEVGNALARDADLQSFDALMSSQDIDLILSAAVSVAIAMNRFSTPKDEQEWLFVQAFGTHALIIRNRFSTLTGDDHKILTLATQILASAYIARSDQL